METAITKFKNHPNVTFIKNTFNNAGANFSFQYVSLDETSMEIYKPNPKKAIQATDIPNKVIKFSYFYIIILITHYQILHFQHLWSTLT